MIDEKYIAAVDLGSSKIALCVAKVSGDDVQIVYYKEHPSDGIRGSIVTNPMKASAPLKKAIAEAENELMIKILQVVVGLPRDGVIQQIADGKIERSNPDDYITREEVENLKSIAVEAYPLDDASNQVMYGAVAQSFSIDDQIHLVEDDTIGGLSSTLEGNFKVFIGSRKATNAIDKIFNNLGIAIAKKYFLPAVTAKAVLSEDDRQNGVALIDFGGGVTSVAIYHGGIMRHYAAIPFGGKTVTNDIRIESSISDSLAENLKLAYGACMPNKLASMSEKIIQIQYDDQPYKEIPVKYLSEIIDARKGDNKRYSLLNPGKRHAKASPKRHRNHRWRSLHGQPEKPPQGHERLQCPHRIRKKAHHRTGMHGSQQPRSNFCYRNDSQRKRGQSSRMYFSSSPDRRDSGTGD